MRRMKRDRPIHRSEEWKRRDSLLDICFLNKREMRSSAGAGGVTTAYPVRKRYEMVVSENRKWKFPGGPVFKTLHSNCFHRGHRFDAWLGN